LSNPVVGYLEKLLLSEDIACNRLCDLAESQVVKDGPGSESFDPKVSRRKTNLGVGRVCDLA
jgi:hypothetical protein